MKRARPPTEGESGDEGPLIFSESDGDDDAALEIGGYSAGGHGSQASEASGEEEVYQDLMLAAAEEDEEGEDLFDDDVIAKDYQLRPELDTYDVGQLDDKDYGDISMGDRLQAERVIRQRKRQQLEEQQGVRMPASLLLSDSDDDGDLHLWKRRKRRKVARRKRESGDGDGDELRADMDGMTAEDRQFIDFEDEDDDDIDLDLEAQRGPLQEFLTLDAPRRRVQKEFLSFISTFALEGSNNSVPFYLQRVKAMCAQNKASLMVNYEHLSVACKELAVWLVDAPTEMLEILDEVALHVTLQEFPEYSSIHSNIHVRITDLPIEDSLRDIRQEHLNAFIKVCGVVTRRTAVFPQLRSVVYKCDQCNSNLGPFQQTQGQELRPSLCGTCQAKGPFTLNVDQTTYESFQRVSLQESPGTVPPGRLPRTKDVVLLGDLVDTARPGEEVEVTGIYKHNYDALGNFKQGFPVFSTIIVANHVTKREEALPSLQIDEMDEAEIRRLSKTERIADRVCFTICEHVNSPSRAEIAKEEQLIASIAPSICGHLDVKTAICVSLFGGNTKHISQDGRKDLRRMIASDKAPTAESHTHRIRGDINVLLMGDPGTAKSQFLKFVEKTAHRAIYTTGQGASAVGLTAAVHKDSVTKEWTLDGGALVLADRGVCMIDEFDKMNDKDRTSIHEAMEQQSISISKAGIVTTLQARCSIIAAANPIKGRYDSSVSFAQNVELTEPILSRFDILCVLRDTVHPAEDEMLAAFVVGSHVRSHPDNDHNNQDVPALPTSNDVEPLDQHLFRKYIMFARAKCQPKLTNIDRDKIKRVYSELRSASKRYKSGLPMGVRHLESILRISEAHARMHLRQYVRDDDVDMAVKIIVDSFIGSQKHSVARSLSQSFKKFVTFKKDNNDLLLYLLQTLVGEVSHYQERMGTPVGNSVTIKCEDFETRARTLDIVNLHEFYSSGQFKKNKFELDMANRLIIRRFDS